MTDDSYPRRARLDSGAPHGPAAVEARVLGGRYRLGKVIGRGGMAVVSEARDLRLGRDVAVKELRLDLASDPTFQARFRREAQAAAGLNHPNIVSVYDTGEELDRHGQVGVPYIVMELVHGRTLRDILREGRPILPQRALEFTQGVLDALSYSHKAGIIHRDIKPANVMLTTSGSIKVMDFGIARAVSDTSATMTQTAAVIGTAQYLSPEQARGESVDTRSDLYSAGCLLYELLVGRPPFQGDSPVSVAYQHVREAPVAPSQLDAEITAPMDAVVLRALAKDPDDRYQSAAEMRDDIGRILGGQRVLATLPPPVPPLMAASGAASASTAVLPTASDQLATSDIASVAVEEPPKRRGALWWTLGIIAVLVGAGLFASQYFWPQETGPEMVKVPSGLIGQRPLVAEDHLRGLGLTAVIENVNGADDATRNTVTATSPQAQTEVAKGSEVTLRVNVGPVSATIPDVRGLSYADALNKLKEAGFTNVVRENAVNEPAEAKADEVTAMSPSSGTEYTASGRITVFVATGRSLVPDLKGFQLDDARTELERFGFASTRVREEVSTIAAGTVLRTLPTGGGAPFPRTETIELIVAVAGPEPDPPNSTSASPSGSASSSPSGSATP